MLVHDMGEAITLKFKGEHKAPWWVYQHGQLRAKIASLSAARREADRLAFEERLKQDPPRSKLRLRS